MNTEIQLDSEASVIFGNGEAQFKRILATLENTSRLAISTYSIPTRFCDEIVKATPGGCSIEIIMAIPALGQDRDWKEKLLSHIKNKKLDEVLFLPSSREVSVYFLHNNHSKMIITDTAAYVGSANFTFGSNSNFESGVYFQNQSVCNQIYSSVFCPLMNKAERFSGRDRDVASQVKWLLDATEYTEGILAEKFDIDVCVTLQQIVFAVDNLKSAFVVHEPLSEIIAAFNAPTSTIGTLLWGTKDLLETNQGLSWRTSPDSTQKYFNDLLENSSSTNIDALASIAAENAESEIQLGSLTSKIRAELPDLISALRKIYLQIAATEF